MCNECEMIMKWNDNEMIIIMKMKMNKVMKW